MTLLTWTILLFAAGAVLLVLELLLPAFGILGILGGGAVLVGVGMCFMFSATAGLIATGGVIASTPLLWMAFLKLYPKTYVGRRTLLPAATSDITPLPVQIGQRGVVTADLRPTGECDFGGTKVETLSGAGLLPVGTKVVVVNLDDRRPVVRAL